MAKKAKQQAEESGTTDIWLSAEIKQNAEGALAAISTLYEEMQSGLFGERALLKYVSSQNAAEKRKLLQSLSSLKLGLAYLVHPTGPGRPETIVEEDGESSQPTSQWVEIDLSDFVPVYFNTLLDDIVRTQLQAIPVEKLLIALAKSYLALFKDLIKADVLAWRDPEDTLTPEVASWEEKALSAHRKLHDFLGALVAPTHEIAINEDFSIVIDGKPTTDLKDRDLKTVLLLAYYGTTHSFEAEDFCKRHTGDDTDAHKVFYRLMDQARQTLPYLQHVSVGGGKRITTGVQFITNLSAEEILKAPVLAKK